MAYFGNTDTAALAGWGKTLWDTKKQGGPACRPKRAASGFLRALLQITALLLIFPGCAAQPTPTRGTPQATREEVVRREANARGVALTAQEEAGVIKQLEADVAEYALEGSSDSLDIEQLREEYLFDALSDKLCAAVTGNVTVEEEKLRAWYDARYAALKTAFADDPGLFKNQQEGYERYGGVPPLLAPEGYIRFRHILVTDEGTANDILARIRAGAPFGELLKEYGTDAGMKLEPYQSRGYLTSAHASTPDYIFELKEAALALTEPGDVSGVVESSAGFHIIELVEHVPAGDIPYEAARASIRKLLEAQARREAYEVLLAGWLAK